MEAGRAATPGRAKVRPSAWWYVLVPILSILGLVAGGLFVRSGVLEARDLNREFTRQPVNERGLVTFDEPGSFTMYFHGPERSFPPEIEDLLDTLDIEFTEVATGESVSLHPYESDSGASEDGYRVAAIKTFRIERAGDYRLEIRTSAFRGDQAGVSVGPSQFEPLKKGAIYGLLAVGVGLIAAMSACITVVVQRGRWRWLSQVQSETAHAPWPPR